MIDLRQEKSYSSGMNTLCRMIALALFGSALPAGTNWRTVWLEPNPVLVAVGKSMPYVVKGIPGRTGTVIADLTHNPYLSIVSSDENIVTVDRAGAQLIGKSEGHAEIRVSFSECTSINRVAVMNRAAEERRGLETSERIWSRASQFGR
jgi:hypothetical protein